ncbi:MAG: hypothetical protein ACK5L8_08060 [Marinicella pacifica]
MKFVFISMLWVLFSLPSEARTRSLSMDMQADILYTHLWLNYNKKAFDPDWLKQEIKCHFNDDHDDCHHLPALLGMHYFLVPKSEGLDYARKIEPYLRYDEYLHREIAMLLFMYGDKRFIDELDLEFVANYGLSSTQHYDSSYALEKLNSSVDDEVVEGIDYVSYFHEQLPKPSKALELIKAIDSDANHQNYYDATQFLRYFFYKFKPKPTSPPDMGRIIVTSGMVVDRAEYLSSKPISKVWKFHAKDLSVSEPCERRGYDNEMTHFFGEFENNASSNSDVKAKIKHIIKLPAFKHTTASFKIRAAHYLSKSHPKISHKILKKAYKQATPLVKSTLIATYPNVFKSNERLWKKLKASSSQVDKRLIEYNHKQWLK